MTDHKCNTGVMWDGSPMASLLFIAQSPGTEEVLQGRPLVGASGNVTWKVGARFGILRQDVAILNACCQIPMGGAFRAAPTQQQLDECRETFDAFLRASRPRVIVCLGGVAFRALSGLGGNVDALRGQLFIPSDCAPKKVPEQIVVGYKKAWESQPTGEFFKSGKKKGQPKFKKVRVQGDPKYKKITVEKPRPLPESVEWIMPTLHPASLIYNQYATLPAFQSDLARIRQLLDPAGERPREIVYETRPTPLGSGPIVLDIENPGGPIQRIGFATLDGAWTAPWAGDTIAEAASILMSDALKIGHNLPYDMYHLGIYGIEVAEPHWDTMLAFQMLQPDLFKGLEKVTSFYFPVRPWKHLSGSEPAYYNACDVVHTRGLYEPLRNDLASTGMLDHFENVIMRDLVALVSMKTRGLRCDDAALREWRTDLDRQHDMLVTRWSGMHPHVDYKSPPQLKRLLYEELALPVQKNKSTVTTDDSALVALLGRGNDDTVRTLRELREVSKLRSTYADVQFDPEQRIHPNYLPSTKDTIDDVKRKGLAASGRLASSEPNIQNQPQVARRIYVPEPGFAFLEADWSQLELRIAAALSGDSALASDLESDVFQRFQDRIGCDRTRAKNVIYGTIYGAGPRTLSVLLKRKGAPTPEAECRRLQNLLAQQYPKLWAWRRRTVALGVDQKWIANPFGRRRYFYMGQKQAPEMIDFLPQSTGADMLWTVLRPLHDLARSVGGYLVCTVHDSILLEVPSAALNEAAIGVRALMEQEWPQISPGFRVPCAIKTSTTNWGAMNAYEEANSIHG